MSEWISVEEKLPTDDKLKAVRYCRSDTGKHLGIALSHFTKSQFSGRFDFEFNRGTQPVRVTHWVSFPGVLPDAPE